MQVDKLDFINPGFLEGVLKYASILLGWMSSITEMPISDALTIPGRSSIPLLATISWMLLVAVGLFPKMY